MFGHKRKKRASVELNFVPLIDVAFNLLIFLAVVASFSANNPGIKINVPAAETAAASQQKGVQISITSTHEILIDGQPIQLADLSTEIQNRKTKNPDMYIRVNADKTTAYENVIQVMDQVRLGGCNDIVLEVVKVVQTE